MGFERGGSQPPRHMYDEGCVEERKLSGLIRAGCAVVEAALTSQPRGEMLKHSPTRDLSSNYKEQAGIKNHIYIYHFSSGPTRVEFFAGPVGWPSG